MTKPPEEPSIGRQVDQFVAALDLEGASNEDIAALAEQLVGMGREAVEGLARGALRPGPSRREQVAALLACLEGEGASWALATLGEVLGSRSVSPTERVWLLTILRRLEEAAASPARGGAGSRAAGEEPGELPDGLLADETEWLLWREELETLTPAEQEMALAPILEGGDARFLPLLEMAMSLRQPSLDVAVASGLARFPTPATLPLLRELLRRADPLVRKRARETLLALERQGVETREVFVASVEESDEPVVAALATRPDRGGQMAVLIARGNAPGRVRYAVVVIDPVEGGIVRAWGESGLTEAEFREHLVGLGNQVGQDFLPLDVNTAQALVAEAEEYACRQGRELPAEYVAWRRCVGKPGAPAELPVAFAPSCSECGKRVRGGDIARGGLVVGRVALCARCAEKPRGCAVCGRALHHIFDDFFVREAGGRVQFVCLRCARGRQGKSSP
jgi:hypothetical protein